MIKIALLGASGKMGQALIQQIQQQCNKFILTAIINRDYTDDIQDKNINYVDMANNYAHSIDNQDNINVINLSNLHKINDIDCNNSFDVLIDFSAPNSCLIAVEYCVQHKIPIIIGTTGFHEDAITKINLYSKQIPILMSANMSLSVNVLLHTIKNLTKQLTNFEVEIIEAHHRSKKDAPSGTALALGKAIANVKGLDFDSVAKYDRHHDDNLRNKTDIGFSSIRGGNIVGTHEVMFISDNEKLTIKSEITNRDSFAIGALLAVEFIIKQTNGMYDMSAIF